MDYIYRPRQKKYILRYIILILLIIGGFFAVNFGLAYKKITIDNGSKAATINKNLITLGNVTQIIKGQDLDIPSKESDRYDVLILANRGEDDPNGGLLTDTIILLSLDKKTGKSSMISIPRDLYANINKVFEGKVNEIYEVGLRRGESAKFTKNTFSRITGVYIDNLVVLDFQAFIKLIDTIDGIDITLDKPFEEKLQWGYPFELPAGVNHLNSEQALYYARSRFSSSDFDRARRQHEVIIAVKDKLMSLDVLSNPLKINSIISDLGDSVKSDINLLNITDLLLLWDLAKQGNPEKLVLTTENVLYQTTEDNLYILLPKLNDYKEIHKAFHSVL